MDKCDDAKYIEDKIKNGLLDPSLVDDEVAEENERKEMEEDKKKESDLDMLDAEKKKEQKKSIEELEEEKIPAEDENAEELKKLITQDLINKDLAMNIILDGKLGSYRQKAFEEELSEETEYAVLDVMTKGDLSSFRWIKSNMKESLEYPALLYPLQAKHVEAQMKTTGSARFKPFLVDIYYSALNFKDVMVASGRVPRSAYPSTNTGATNLIGMEFSGKMKDGRRIMGNFFFNFNLNLVCNSKTFKTLLFLPVGILPGSGISTKFLCIDEANVFSVPEDWTLAQAATIPVVYLTAYYSLFIRANLLRGEKVLIHAGSGGVGFAAISICLAYGCEVFTTVSTKEKKEFLQKHFPSLQDRNFANSRDLSFEEHVLKETDGYGVDIVLNSLAEEKLRASIRCLAKFGRFLEIVSDTFI